MAKTLTKSDIAKEILKRRNARKSFIEFNKYVLGDDYETPWHVKELCQKLQDVIDGKITRLIINLPPRHSKSYHVSVLLPAYILGIKSERLIVQASNGAELAKKMSSDCRRIVTSKKYHNLFPNVLDKLTEKMDVKRSLKEWQTAKGGGYFAVGVGGGLIGRGCDVAILDDLTKSREEASSELKRDRIWDWYQSVLYTRLMPGASIIVVQTRFHLDDLTGRLLKDEQNDGEKWDILDLPAVSDEYEALWEDRYPRKRLDQIKQTIGLREWTSQYLQKPTVDGGNRFKTTGIKIHSDINDFPKVTYMRAWDLASTAKQLGKRDPDYSVGALGCVIKDSKGLKHLWIKDLVRGQWEAPKRDEMIKQTANLDGAGIGVYIEAFGPYVDTFNHIRRVLSGRNIVRKSRLPGDKAVKASPLEPIFEAGNVHLLKAPWNDAFITEFMNFDGLGGSHDDQVDVCSIIIGESIKSKSGLLVC